MALRGFFIAMALAILLTAEVTNGKKTFNYTITNVLVEPHFNNTITLDIVNGQTMIRYMEEAVDTNGTLFSRFKATYYPNNLGYFITSINNRPNNASNSYYWFISNSSGVLDVGVSSYTPAKDDEILFNFTVYVAGK